MENIIAKTILEQLGGNKFIVMTGSRIFLEDGNTLRMTLVKNMSKANRLEITLDKITDTYTMRFYKYTPGKLSKKTLAWVDEKIVEVYKSDLVYADSMAEIFTRITGMDTRMPQLDHWMSAQ